MRLSLIASISTTTAAALCLFAAPALTAADRCATNESQVWVEGSWVSYNGAYSWRPGYWQTTQTTQTTVCTTPAPQWEEGHWAQGANGWVWIEGHYQAAPTVCTTVPACPPTTVIVQQPPQVVYTQPCRPQTTVVIGSSVGYGYGCNNGYYSSYSYNHGYGYNSYGYNNGACATYQRPVCSTGVAVGVVVAPPRPVVIRPPSVHLPPLPSPSSIANKLPALPTLPKLPNPFRR
jgi:hypothetical protein